MKIYTKGGDKGQTSLLGGIRVDKNDARVSCYGRADELGAHLGIAVNKISGDFSDKVLTEIEPNRLCRSIDKDPSVEVAAMIKEVRQIQLDLFRLGTIVAGLDIEKKPREYATIEFWQKQTGSLENQIDRMETVLPAMKSFILSGGIASASQIHLARTISRALEREFITLIKPIENPILSEGILPWLNRLSDYLFVLARYCNFLRGQQDIPVDLS